MYISYVRSLFKCFVLFLKDIFLATSQGMWDLGSLTRDQINAPCIGSLKSSPLDPQVRPLSIFRTELSCYSFFAREWRLWEGSKLSQWSNQRENWHRPWNKDAFCAVSGKREELSCLLWALAQPGAVLCSWPTDLKDLESPCPMPGLSHKPLW